MQVEGTECAKTWIKKDRGFSEITGNLGGIVDWVPDHLHKMSITIENVLWILFVSQCTWELYLYY